MSAQERIAELGKSGQTTAQLLAKLGIDADKTNPGKETRETERPARDVPLA